MRKNASQDGRDPPVRPRIYLSVLLLMLIIVLLFVQQWDWALAVFIGLLVGNGLTSLGQG